jgi:hypothetical protein
MVSLKDVLVSFLTFKKGKAETIQIDAVADKTRKIPKYGNELLCARYYNEDESHYIDLYLPFKGPIGVWMSGGTDSTMSAFLLAKTIKEFNLDIKILPMSFKRDNKPWNLWTATYVVEKIEEILNLKKGEIFLPHNYCYFGNHEAPDFLEKMSKHTQTLKEKNIVTLIYNGLTKNPDPLPPELEAEREFIRDDPTSEFIEKNPYNKEEMIISMPFLYQDKSFIASLYKKHNLIETLLPHTRSCEGLVHNTKFFNDSCGRCWWCRERTWAFSKYTPEPIKYISPPSSYRRSCIAV